MLKSPSITLPLLLLAVCFAAPVFAEEDASMHQVYMAAEAGKFNEAQAMMDKVLLDHPNSAKAHFVEAELLAKQGLFSNAGVELGVAERLQPGLPFAKPEAVQNLKRRISSASNGAMQPNTANQGIPSTVKEWMPSILLIFGVGLIVVLIGFMSRRNSRMISNNGYAGAAPIPNSNMSSVAGNGVGSVTGQPVAGGMGSGIMGNLATGAALGAGVVAGEALMHRFIDGDKNSVIPEPSFRDSSPWNTSGGISENDDMGGTDFGVADASSWDDDGASDGGDDWT
ncbi:MAG: tetratricopeptide repeat protein [Methylobacter sp.]|nr:tetratricopeptide repeat protein [Methylobacter sp.]